MSVRKKYFEAFGDLAPYSFGFDEDEFEKLLQKCIDRGEPLTDEELDPPNSDDKNILL